MCSYVRTILYLPDLSRGWSIWLVYERIKLYFPDKNLEIFYSFFRSVRQVYDVFDCIFDLFAFDLGNRSKKRKFLGVLMYSFMVNVLVLRFYTCFLRKFPC
jgi:hypothetical protein